MIADPVTRVRSIASCLFYSLEHHASSTYIQFRAPRLQHQPTYNSYTCWFYLHLICILVVYNCQCTRTRTCRPKSRQRFTRTLPMTYLSPKRRQNNLQYMLMFSHLSLSAFEYDPILRNQVANSGARMWMFKLLAYDEGCPYVLKCYQAFNIVRSELLLPHTILYHFLNHISSLHPKLENSYL